MDIRPVDVQMFINKASQINKNENREQMTNEQFQLFSDNFKKTNEQQNQKTIETNKSEDSQINKDGKNKKNKYKYKNKKNTKSKENNKESRNLKESQGLFNVSI